MNTKILTYIYFNSNIVNKKYKNFNDFVKATKNQIGGSSTKYIIKYKSDEYIFEKHNYEDLYILSSFDKDEDCVVVSIDKTIGIANINKLNANVSNCTKSKHRVGTKLLKITLKFLEKYKNNLGITVITLYDTSYKQCYKKELELIYLSVLTSGDTWYGKYGFRPVTVINNSKIIINNQLNEIYENNKNIMSKLTVSNIDLIKYFIGTKLENTIKKVVLTFPNMLIKDVVFKLLTEFDKTCEIFSEIYIKLFNDCGLKISGTYYGKFLY